MIWRCRRLKRPERRLRLRVRLRTQQRGFVKARLYITDNHLRFDFVSLIKLVLRNSIRHTTRYHISITVQFLTLKDFLTEKHVDQAKGRFLGRRLCQHGELSRCQDFPRCDQLARQSYRSNKVSSHQCISVEARGLRSALSTIRGGMYLCCVTSPRILTAQPLSMWFLNGGGISYINNAIISVNRKVTAV